LIFIDDIYGVWRRKASTHSSGDERERRKRVRIDLVMIDFY
jgi:hypothetical protein